MHRQDCSKIRIGRNEDTTIEHVRGWLRLRRPAWHTRGDDTSCIRLIREASKGWEATHCRRESHAERGSGSSLSVADAAAKRRHSRMSAKSRSGYSVRIWVSVRPPASRRRMVATGMRRWRTQGTPPIWRGSTVMRSKLVTFRLSQVWLLARTFEGVRDRLPRGFRRQRYSVGASSE